VDARDIPVRHLVDSSWGVPSCWLSTRRWTVMAARRPRCRACFAFPADHPASSTRWCWVPNRPPDTAARAGAERCRPTRHRGLFRVLCRQIASPACPQPANSRPLLLPTVADSCHSPRRGNVDRSSQAFDPTALARLLGHSADRSSPPTSATGWLTGELFGLGGLTARVSKCERHHAVSAVTERLRAGGRRDH
jgi:hypothetical protein